MNQMKLVATVAVALGVAAGSYGIASAAGTSGSSSSSSLDAATPAAQQAAPQGWGPQRSDETLLTGDTAAKVRAAAVAKEPGATVSRVETDADGKAAYEVHMIRSDARHGLRRQAVRRGQRAGRHAGRVARSTPGDADRLARKPPSASSWGSARSPRARLRSL